MSLNAGTRLGHYEILIQIGAGGMGEVYRSHDPRLGRDVAIKVSAAQFTERFEREARAVAALNHPNICTLHDVGPNYLVMEYVEGVTLSDRIGEGPIPLEESLHIARQIAEALEAAHEKGIVHRDLKPGNIKIRPDGSVKVLDFGLAQVSQAEGRAMENSPTLSMAATQAGVILGTAAYMSPEQARGKPVDKRADIWAFGVVLHEMLTGERLFKGEDVTETLASVVKEHPRLDKVPVRVRRLLKKCLEKDPKKRLRDIGDAWELLEEDDLSLEPLSPAAASSRLGKTGWAVAVLFLLTSGLLAFIHFREATPFERVLRYTLAPPENGQVHTFAISPDGRYVVMAAMVSGKRQLWLHDLEALQAQPMAFTDDAMYPFWSPDGRYIGFFAQNSLKKVAVGGGPSQPLCPAPAGRGGSWNSDDVIVFSPNGVAGVAIQRVSAAGGVPADISQRKGSNKHPVFLPDGRHFLYVVSSLSPEENGIYVSSLDGQENRRVLPDVSSVVYAPSLPGARAGHLLFTREGTLMAQPFDAASAQVSGDVFPVAASVSISQHGSYAPVSVSDNGVLLYVTGGIAGGTNQIAWFDRSGNRLEPVGAPGSVRFPSISPDEKLLAFTYLGGSGGDIKVRDLARGTDTRLTSHPSLNLAPFWSPKGDRIVFSSNRKNGVPNLFWKATNGTGQDEWLWGNANVVIPSQWSRDGRFIVYWEVDPKTKRDIWVLPTADDRKPIPVARTEFEEFFGQLSPDSHWMAYTSDSDKQREVFVVPFPPPAEGRWKISNSGGQAPRWSGNGKELFFEAADGKLMVVPVIKAAPGPNPSFEYGKPVALFDARILHDGNDVLFEYDVTDDGQRFLINTTGETGPASTVPLTVVVNWNSR